MGIKECFLLSPEIVREGAGQQAAALKYVAETFRIPIVVTNQVGEMPYVSSSPLFILLLSISLGQQASSSCWSRLVEELARGNHAVETFVQGRS